MMQAKDGPLPQLPLAPSLQLPYSEQRRRFRYFLRSAALAVFLLAAGFIVAGFPWLALSNFVVALGFLVLMVWGTTSHNLPRLRLGTHVTLGWGLAAILWNAVFTGGNASFALWFMAMLPLLSAFLGGRHTAYIWAAISILTALLMWVWRPWPLLLPQYSLTPGMLFCAHVSLIFLSTTFAEAARHANERHIEALGQKLSAEHDAKQMAETARLLEERARLAAEAAARTKANFLATMSHEIRTPLNAVIGFNNLLLDMELGTEERRLVELAHQSGEALLQLINDVLDFSKIEAGHLELEPLVFDPHLVVKGALALLQEQARRKGLPLTVTVEAPHGLRGDPSRLRQILVNLLSNAVKFTDRGEVRLRCREWQQDARIWLRFEVQDSGIGMDEATRTRLFRPFTQADASTTRRFGGTGLGLAICKELTAMMGGRIGCDSTPGQGSTFWVELPFDVVPEAEWPDHHDVRHLQVAGKGPRSYRVLLAEDNAVNQIMAREMLKRLGCQADVVGNGQEAVEAWQRLPYDLIFMDCDMPVLDGFAASRAIRAQEGPSEHIPIVAITAAAFQGDREKCLAAGMDDYLSKPVRLVDMQAALSRWVDPERERPAAAGRPGQGAVT